MRLFIFTIGPNQTRNIDVPESSYCYIDKMSSGATVDLVFYSRTGSQIASLDNVAVGSKFKSDVGKSFTQVSVQNNSASDATINIYVGNGEFSTSKTNLAGSVSVNSASTLQLYSAIVTVTSELDIKSLLPAGAVMSSMILQVDDTSGADCEIYSKNHGTETEGGIIMKKGKYFSSDNSFPIFVKPTPAGTLKLRVMIDYVV